MPTDKVVSGGFAMLQYALLDSDGVPKGSTGTIANGSDDGLGRLEGVKSASIEVTQAERAYATGDDRSIASFLFEPVELPTGTVELAIADSNFEAAVQGFLVYDFGNTSIVALQGKDPTREDVLTILSRQAKSKDALTSGSARWEHYVLPKAQFVPLGSAGFTEREVANSRFDVTCNPATRFPWMEALSTSSNVGTAEAPIFRFVTDNRISLHTFVGDGTADEITLDHTPAGNHTTGYVKVYEWDGTTATALTATTEFTVSGNVVTIITPPTAGTEIIVYYEYTS